jgi:hypothetical protein
MTLQSNSQRHNLQPVRIRRCHREAVAVPSSKEKLSMAGAALNTVGMDQGFASNRLAETVQSHLNAPVGTYAQLIELTFRSATL